MKFIAKILHVTMNPLFWEEDCGMQLLNNTNSVWTVNIKTGKTVSITVRNKDCFLHFTHYIQSSSVSLQNPML